MRSQPANPESGKEKNYYKLSIKSEIRSSVLEVFCGTWRGSNERRNKTCPNVFAEEARPRLVGRSKVSALIESILYSEFTLREKGKRFSFTLCHYSLNI